MTKDYSNYALNNKTGRYCKMGSRTYIRGVKSGDIEVKQEPTPAPAPAPTPAPSPVVAPPLPAKLPEFETKVAETCTDIVKENPEKFAELTQAQTDRLLRKMLYEKLCLNDDKPEKKEKKSKKPKKKARFKVKKPKTPPPSSDESSSEESSDW